MTEDKTPTIKEMFAGVDAKDWDRLLEHLAKDNSGHGRWWQEVIKEVRDAVERAEE